MCRTGYAIFCWIALALSPALAFGQIVMTPPIPASGNELVINGTQKSDPKNWPATFWFTSEVTKKSCTSTAVGPRTFLTAAHCITEGQVGLVKSALLPTYFTCYLHPQYTPDISSPATVYDVALCRADADISLPFAGTFERLNMLDGEIAINQSVLLLGFGCRQQFGGGPSGELWEGAARRTANMDRYDYIVTDGGAAVCQGDSGSSVYKMMASGLSRSIVAVSSRGDFSHKSFLSPIALPPIRSFIQDWSSKHNSAICGIDSLPSGVCHE